MEDAGVHKSRKDHDRIAVSELSQGEKGRISHVASEDSSMIRKLISMGFVPGREVELSASVSEKGARIVKLGEATIALDRDMASEESSRSIREAHYDSQFNASELEKIYDR